MPLHSLNRKVTVVLPSCSLPLPFLLGAVLRGRGLPWGAGEGGARKLPMTQLKSPVYSCVIGSFLSFLMGLCCVIGSFLPPARPPR